MSRGHPTTRMVLLCIVAFFAGRFLQLPGLPDGSGSGVSQNLYLLCLKFTHLSLIYQLMAPYLYFSTCLIMQPTIHRARKALLENPQSNDGGAHPLTGDLPLAHNAEAF